MTWVDPCLQRSRNAAGDLIVRLGGPQLDVYLEFLAVRSRPNTVLAAAYDLRVFFAVVGKPPGQVTAADVLAFVTAQHTGGTVDRLQLAGDGGVWGVGADRAAPAVECVLAVRIPAGARRRRRESGAAECATASHLCMRPSEPSSAVPSLPNHVRAPVSRCPTTMASHPGGTTTPRLDGGTGCAYARTVRFLGPGRTLP